MYYCTARYEIQKGKDHVYGKSHKFFSPMWENHKGNVLQKDDKSFKGTIDQPVRELVGMINESVDFLTTSSCSGRIMLINELSKEKRKNKSEFLFVSHDYVADEVMPKIMKCLSVASGSVFLKLEPIIVHVQCRTLDNAIWLLHLMKLRDQFKHSCIVSAINDKWIVAIMGLVKMEVPLLYDDELLVNAELLTKYIRIANERMVENFRAIEALTAFIKSGILSQRSRPDEQIDYRNMRPIGIIGEKTSNSILIPSTCISIENRAFSLDRMGRFVTDLSDQKRIGIRHSLDGQRPRLSDNSVVRYLQDTFLLIDQTGDMWALCWFMDKPNILEFLWRKVETTSHDVSQICDIQWVKEEIMSNQPFRGTYEKYGNILVVQESGGALPQTSWEKWCRSKDCTAVLRRYCGSKPLDVLVNLTGDNLVADFKDNGTRYRIDFSRFSFSPNMARERLALDISGESDEYIVEYSSSPTCFGIHLLRKCKNIKKYLFVTSDEREPVQAALRECLELNGIPDTRYSLLPLSRLHEQHACEITRMIICANENDGSVDLDGFVEIARACVNKIHIEGLKDKTRIPVGFTIVSKSHNDMVDLVRKKV